MVHDLLDFTSQGRERLHKAISISSIRHMTRGNLLYIPLGAHFRALIGNFQGWVPTGWKIGIDGPIPYNFLYNSENWWVPRNPWNPSYEGPDSRILTARLGNCRNCTKVSRPPSSDTPARLILYLPSIYITIWYKPKAYQKSHFAKMRFALVILSWENVICEICLTICPTI